MTTLIDHAPPAPGVRPTHERIRTIVQIVTETMDVPEGLIMAKSRRGCQVSLARWIAMYVARQMTDAGVCEIARAFKRDHTSVIHAMRRMNELLPRDEMVRGWKDLICIKFAEWEGAF